MLDVNVQENFYKTFNISEKERNITDDRLLKIMAAICWSYTCTQNDFDVYEVSTKDDLADSILEHAIGIASNDDYVYCKVREIFKQEDDEELL